MEKTLSKRADVFLGEPEFLMKCFIKCEQDPFNSNTKSGMINLGTAVNALVEDLIADRLQRGDVFGHKREWQHYHGLNGTPDLLISAAKFLTKRITHNKRTVSEDNIRLVNGVTAALEVMSWVLADPGDVILVPVPTYARFFADMNERMKTQVVGMHLDENEYCPFTLSGELLERHILEQKSLGKDVKGFIFCNPNNPLGAIYPRETMFELMRICAKYKVHFISDEIYALSIFGEKDKFESILCFNEEELPDPNRTHFLWGMSKDFGLAGFRMGFIHTFNKDLITCLDGMAIYACVPAHMQNVAVTLLQDDKWLDEVYFPTNIERLKNAFENTVSKLNQIGVSVFPAQAGLFLWANFSSYLESNTKEAEMALFDKLFNDDKIYLVPGTEFGCTKYGWFRIIFAVDKIKLDVALERLVKGLQAIKNK